MNHISKKVFSLLVSIMMIFSMVPTMIFADSNETIAMKPGDSQTLSNENYEDEVYNWTSTNEEVVSIEYASDRESINLLAKEIGEATITLMNGENMIKAYDVVVSAPKAAKAPKTEPAVASIGSNQYASLAEAIEAAQSGETIKLLADIDISATGAIIEKSLTLDLNGFNLKGANTKTETITINAGTFTLKDSKGTGKLYSESKYSAGGTTGIIYVTGEDTKFVMESGLIEAVCDDIDNDGEFGVVAFDGGDITINGGTIKAGWYAISGNGNNTTQDSQFIINGGTIISEGDYAIFCPQSGKLTINDGTIYGYAGGLAMQRGSLEINGGLITGKGQGSTGNWGDGTGMLGNAAISLTSRYGSVDAKITGGKITAEGNAVLINPSTSGYTSTIKITGGTYSSDVSEYAAEGFQAYEKNGEYVVANEKDAPKNVYIPTSVIVMSGSTYQFKPTVSPSTAYNNEYRYTSSDESVATVDNDGLLTAKQAGTVTVVVKSLNGKTSSCKVTVQAEPTSIELDKDTVTIMQSRSMTLTVSIKEENAYQAVRWSSDHPEIASVSSKGTLTGKTSGSATITVTTENGLSDTITVIVKPQPVKVDVPSSVNVMLGRTLQLEPVLTTADAYDVLTYKSSNTKYVIVDNKGIVTPVRVGSAYITVKAANGKYDKVKVNVKAVPKKFSLSNTSHTGYVGEEYTLTTKVSPSNAYVDDVIWISSNPLVINVDNAGNVSLLRVGTAKIIATNINGKVAECEITVQNLPDEMTINETTANVMYKKYYQITPEFEGTDPIYTTCSYKSSNTKYVTVSSTGKVYGKKVGSATITVTDKAGHTDTIKIVVKKAPTKLSLNAKSLTLMETMDYQITTKVNSSSYYNENYSYTSSNKAVATIDSTGKVTALTPGYTLITVKSLNGLKKTCKVYVKAQPEAIAFTTDDYQVMVGKTVTVKALGTGTDAYTPVSDYEIVAGNDLATLDSKTGMLTAIQTGTVTIKATTINDKSTTVEVAIKKEPTAITSDVTGLTVKKGKTISLAEHLSVLETDGYQVISYSSSNKKYATVTTDGTVKGVKAGKVYITCKTANGKYVKIKVTVK